jgi:hypothetical protein
VGKDTLCNLAAKHLRVRNISTITPIKDIARQAGWDGSKDDRSRKFLADLKKLSVEYNDFPTNWALGVYREFLETDEQILFVHIREPEEIAKFVKATDGAARALLIRGGDRMKKAHYGNHADDSVEDYSYDYYFVNDKTIAEAEEEFVKLMQKVLEEV